VGVGYFSLNNHSSGDHSDGICRVDDGQNTEGRSQVRGGGECQQGDRPDQGGSEHQCRRPMVEREVPRRCASQDATERQGGEHEAQCGRLAAETLGVQSWEQGGRHGEDRGIEIDQERPAQGRCLPSDPIAAQQAIIGASWSRGPVLWTRAR